MYIKTNISFLLAMVVMGIFTSCSTIVEDLPLCTNQLAFRYDYNMKYADAFPVTVKKLDVFVFDADERFVTVFSEERENFGEGFVIPLALPEGTYRFVVWAGRYERSYEFKKELVPGESTPVDLNTKIRRVGGIVDKELDALWYGQTRVTLTPDESKTITIGLTKDTNKFRILVQGPDGWDGDDLQFSIVDNNGYIGGDNELLSDDTIKYMPYFQQVTDVDGPVVVAEMNTSRLIESSHPRLRINYPDGTQIIDIDLIQYLLLTKMEGHDMGVQEYLDRQDEYSMIFFLSHDHLGQIVVMKIKVNGWIIRLQNGDF